MLSDLCERGACETCFEDEIDGCGHECHGPLDGAAGESTGACRAHDPADGLSPVVRSRAACATAPGGLRTLVAPVAGVRGGKTSPPSSLDQPPAAGPLPVTEGALDREGSPVPADCSSLPGSACMEPAEPGTKTPAPATGAAHLDRAPAPGRVPDNAPAGSARASQRVADSVLSAGQAAIAAAMSEAELEEGVRALCADLGVLRFHVRDSRGMNRGLPDDILIGARGVLWWECKAQKGRLTPEQKAVGEALTALGQSYAVRRPADLLNGTIATELAALAGLRAGAA